MNLLGFSITVTLVLIILLGSRRSALLAMLGGILYLTFGQEISVFGLNVYAHRFLELAGFYRVISRREASFHSLNHYDKLCIFAYVYVTVVFVLRSKTGVAFQIGSMADAILCLVTFKGLIGELVDLEWLLSAFIKLLLPYACLITVERFARFNIFNHLGITDYGDWQRGGRPRCQGSFLHASLLGTMAGVFFPLYVGLAFNRKYRSAALTGILLCVLIIVYSNSGGPANCLAVGLVSWLVWGIRQRMSTIRRGIAVVLVVLAMLMDAPIWFLIARVSSISGGGGFHRAYLIDVSMRNLDKWWLAGMDIVDTAGWFPYILDSTGGADMTNQFLFFGITGGILSLLLLVFLVIRCFSGVGRVLTVVRGSQAEPLVWGLGAMLLVHVVNWFGIRYWDQTYLLWFLTVAAISALTDQYLRPTLQKEDRTEGGPPEVELPMARLA